MNNQKHEENGNPATGSEHLLVGIKIAIPVLHSIGACISDDARSCVNDDCFDLPAISNENLLSAATRSKAPPF